MDTPKHHSFALAFRATTKNMQSSLIQARETVLWVFSVCSYSARNHSRAFSSLCCGNPKASTKPSLYTAAERSPTASWAKNPFSLPLAAVWAGLLWVVQGCLHPSAAPSATFPGCKAIEVCGHSTHTHINQVIDILKDCQDHIKLC